MALRKWFSFILLIITLSGLSACGSQATSSNSLPPLKMGHVPWVGFGAIYIADKQDFFEAEKVAVEIMPYQSYSDLSADFATRKLDISTTAYADAIAQAAAGVPLQIVWVFDSSNGGDVVVGSPQISTIEDLRGKRIGLEYGTFSHLFVLEGLKKHGLTENDVQLVNVTADQVPQAIASGQIDAGHTWEPFLSEVVANQGQVLFTSAETPGIILDALRVHAAITAQRSGDIQKVMRAIAHATQWWQANPEAGNQIVAEALGLSASEIPAILTGVHLFNLTENQQAFQPREGLIYKVGEIAISLFLNTGIITQPQELDHLLYAQYLTDLP